jgi:DNA-binding NarL/FixJ family response regulator
MAVDPIRILLADDHKLVRAGIRSLLDWPPDIEVVGEAGDGKETLRLVEALRPRIVMMDIAMPLLNGLETTRRLTKSFPDVSVIILSTYSDEEHVYQALRAGASGYLVKAADCAELERAIRGVAQGETYLSPPISKSMIAAYADRNGLDLHSNERLSPRQTEILQLVAEGRSTKQIALGLSISVKTVETHRAAVMHRLGVGDVAGLIRYAVKIGLIDLS